MKRILRKISINRLREKDVCDMFHFECCARKMGYKTIAGVDEVGRGALAGPVLAAAVILPEDKNLIPLGIKDSKKLTKQKREHLFKKIIDSAVAVGIGIVNNREIDRTSILKASLKAMERAVDGLHLNPDIVLVDGNQKFSVKYNQQEIIKGDSRSISIASASIVAKVIRDSIMTAYHPLIPHYGFEKNMGYGTKKHLDELKVRGHSHIHRTSYRGVITF